MALVNKNLKILIRLTHFLLLPLALVLLFPDVGFSKTVYVSVRTINVRSGAGLEYRVIGVAKIDQALKVLKGNKEWLNVLIPSGEEGWISRKNVKVEKPKSVVIVEYKDTMDRQRRQIEKLRKNFAASMKKNEKLGIELQELMLRQDKLIMENENLKNSRERFFITASVIGGLVIWIMGFLAGQFRHLRENKRFDKMASAAKVRRY